MPKKFQKKVEDFICEKCGEQVKGTGYTNHCPKCLWSKHVDINPGDRAALCGGMMKPVGLEAGKGEFSIVNQCEKCGMRKKNKLSPDDNFDLALQIKA